VLVTVTARFRGPTGTAVPNRELDFQLVTADGRAYGVALDPCCLNPGDEDRLSLTPGTATRFGRVFLVTAADSTAALSLFVTDGTGPGAFFCCRSRHASVTSVVPQG
jgi:hypothetical protein